VAVYDIPQYRALQKRRLDAYRINAKRGKIRGAEKYAARLRLYVPIKSGKLKRSINRKGGVVRVGATGNQGFPYVHWINQTPEMGMTRLLVRPKGKKNPRPYVRIEGRAVLVRGAEMIYGSRPSNWQWTGKVQFAQRALMETRKDWQVLIQRINKKSLMGESI
jgi:hypothetical protein